MSEKKEKSIKLPEILNPDSKDHWNSKKYKKYRKSLLEKPKFGKIFGQYFILFMEIYLIISIIGTIIATNIYFVESEKTLFAMPEEIEYRLMQKYNTYMDMKPAYELITGNDNIENTDIEEFWRSNIRDINYIFCSYSSLRENNLLNILYWDFSMDYPGDKTPKYNVALVDIDTKDVFYKDDLYDYTIIQYNMEVGSATFVIPREYIEKYRELIAKAFAGYDLNLKDRYYRVELNNVYVKDCFAVAEDLIIYEESLKYEDYEKNKIAEIHVDLSDLEGYVPVKTEVDMSINAISSYTLIYPEFTTDSEAERILLTDPIEDKKLQNYIEYGFTNGTEKPKKTWYQYKNLVKTGRVEIGTHRYEIRVYADFDMFEDYGRDFVFVYVFLFILATIIAYALSCSTYRKLKMKYEVAEYQRKTQNAMAHDLKSPLMVISSYAENLKEKVNPEKEAYYLDGIMETVADMDRMIANILNLSKYENSSENIKREDINLDVLVNKLVSRYEDEFSKNGIEVYTEGKTSVNCNIDMMQSALENLIVNAAKYSKDNSVVNITMNEKKIMVTNCFEGTIDKSPEELMNNFVKGDNARSNSSGNGIGLAVVKQAADVHGYKFSVEIDDGVFTAIIEF